MLVKQLVDTFYNLAKEHKLIKSFKYDRLSKGMGVGDELMPHFFLEDPIYIGNAETMSGIVPVTVNFDIVITPQLLQNYGVYPSTEAGQNLCYRIALNFIAKLRDMVVNAESEAVKGIVSWSFMTLKHWSDNDADGVRCTLVLNVRNEINFCDTEEHFDPNKDFTLPEYMEDIDTSDAEGCAVFSDKKLPNFKI